MVNHGNFLGRHDKLDPCTNHMQLQCGVVGLFIFFKIVFFFFKKNKTTNCRVFFLVEKKKIELRVKKLTRDLMHLRYHVIVGSFF